MDLAVDMICQFLWFLFPNWVPNFCHQSSHRFSNNLFLSLDLFFWESIFFHSIIPQVFAQKVLKMTTSLGYDCHRVLDLGCGTGLCGRELRSLFQLDQLVGVDLSVSRTKETKGPWRFAVYKGLCCAVYIGILISYYKDPYEPIRIEWNVSQGFWCRCCWSKTLYGL